MRSKWMSFWGLFLFSIFPVYAHADIGAVQEKVNLGVAQCKGGEYGKGIDTLVDAAMDARRENPKHPINRQWRQHMVACFDQWMEREGAACESRTSREAWDALGLVVQKARQVGGPDVVRKVEARMSRCIGRIAAVHEKSCARDRASLDLVTALAAQCDLKDADRRKMEKLAASCRENRWKMLAEQCRSTFSAALLSEVETMYASFANPQAAVREQYRSCLMAFVQGSREICRTRMAYREGSQLYALAYAKLKELKPVDEAFLARAASWKDECGLMRIRLSVKVDAFAGKVRFDYPAQAELVVVRTEGENQVRACGAWSFPLHNTLDGTCDVTVSVPADKGSAEGVFAGKPWICLSGRILPARGQGSVAKLELKFDTSVARPLVAEQIQWTCPGKPAVVFQEKLFEGLFQNPKFRVLMDFQEKAAVRFRIQDDGGKNRRVTYEGTWQLLNF